MDSTKKKPFFELSKKEKRNRFKAVLDDVLKRDAEMGLPTISRNKDCVRPGMFIHRYPNGKRFLIEINSQNSERKTLKVIR